MNRRNFITGAIAALGGWAVGRMSPDLRDYLHLAPPPAPPVRMPQTPPIDWEELRAVTRKAFVPRFYMDLRKNDPLLKSLLEKCDQGTPSA